MTLSQAIGIRITELCKQKDYSINALASRAGINESTIRSIIDGRSENPKIGSLYYICVAFDMELSDFFSNKLFKIENIDDN